MGNLCATKQPRDQGAQVGERKWPYIRAPQCAMRGCVQKATTMRPSAIFFLLHCVAKLQNYGLVLDCFSLSCNPGAISLFTFHKESEKHIVSSHPLKVPARDLKHKRFRQRLHGTGSVWNQHEIGTDKPCVYTGPGGPVRIGSDLLSGTKWVHL